MHNVTQNGSPSYGVWVSAGTNALYFSAGGSGKYRDNMMLAILNAPYTGGTDAGNNQ